MTTAVKRVLVYGGSGALGDALVTHLKSKSYVNELKLHLI